MYIDIEKLQELIDKKLNNALEDALPLAFAIVKDTARRFYENEEVVVTATDFDRNLSVTRSSILIKDEKAIYLNQWIAGGNEITWDMVHYDCQLIGGVVLHQGKISEMATGEGKTLSQHCLYFLMHLPGQGFTWSP